MPAVDLAAGALRGSSEKLDREIEQLELLLATLKEERRRATRRERGFDGRGFFHPAVEEAVPPPASARSSAA